MDIKKYGLKIVAILMASSTILTGCNIEGLKFNEETFRKINHIGENFTTIAQNVESIDTESIVNGAQDVAEKANEFSEIAESVAVEPEPAVTDVAEADDMDDFTIEDFYSNLLDIDIIAEIMGKIEAYRIRIEAAYNEALRLRDEGIKLIRNGVDSISRIYYSKKMYNLDTLEETIDSIQDIIDGTNDLANGANSLLGETVKTANDIIADAKAYGMQAPEIEELEETLEIAKELEIIPVDDEVVKLLEDALKALKASKSGNVSIEITVDLGEAFDREVGIDQINDIEDIYEIVRFVMAQAEDAAKTVNEIYAYVDDTINLIEGVARDVVKTAEEMGVDQATIDSAQEAIRQYTGIDVLNLRIPRKEIREIEDYIKGIYTQFESIDYEKMLEMFRM